MEFNVEKYADESLFLLSKLIGFKTILDKYNPNSKAPFGLENKNCLKFFLEYALKDGFKVYNADNYAGHIEYGEGSETLGILAHLDVVPVDGQNWQTDPFVLNIKDGRLYARGAVDDKGPLVASYIALKMLKDNGFKSKKKIRLIVGCDEESGSRCLKYYFKKQPLPELGFSPDADFPLIYGEKALMNYNLVGKLGQEEIITRFICGTRYNVVPALAKAKLSVDLKKEYLNYLKKHNYKGEVKGDYYIAYGIACHAMVADKGLNAAFILFDFLEEVHSTPLSKFFKNYFTFDPFGIKMGIAYDDPKMHELTCNVGIVNILDDKITIGVDCRVPLVELKEKMEEKIIKASSTIGLEYELLNFGGYHYVDPDSFLVKTLMNVYQDVTGDRVNEPFTIGGGTYAKFITNAVAFGPLKPNREDVCHIANEYFELEDFKEAILIYAKAIYELCK